MTADVELLPLPQAEEWEDTTAWAKRYARAVAEHNVKKRDAEIEALRAEVERLRLLAGNQHELMKAHGVPLPEDYALPAAADAFVKEYVARRERATRAEAEVEALLAACEMIREHELDPVKFSPIVPAPELAALCRAWLAVQDAPEVWVGESAVKGEGWQMFGADGFGVTLPFEDNQRVRIVKEGE